MNANTNERIKKMKVVAFNMIIPGSSYWNMGFGRNPGEVKNDTEGIQTMKTLGQNMAWLLKKISI
jgi:multimeric flavodoxin WrbA